MADHLYGRKRGCCGACANCSRSIPAASMLSLILLIIGVTASCVSLLVGVPKTRTWIEKPDSFLSFSFIVCIATLCGMISFGFIFLLLATFISRPRNKTFFNTSTKNACARALNVLVIVLLVLLLVAWIGVTVCLTVPVGLFTLFHILYRDTGIEAVDLRHYGIYKEHFVIAGQELDTFYDDGLEVFSCYLIALAGSVITQISLCMFLMVAAANSVHLRDARFSSYSVYNADIGASKNSIIDTKM